ncbi:MAG: TraB/GumN family protein [Gammaproteobacteria bacterium]|nr:TraB/GumN family protein [Gammaproteobacteria bacterium]
MNPIDIRPAADNEPLYTLEHCGRRITLLGTAHISQASAEKVRELIESCEYDAVAIELCPSRYNAIVNPDALAKMDLFEVIHTRKVLMVAANLALGAFQQRMAEQLDITPGAEMRAAIDCARTHHLPVLLIDREIAVTLKRCYHGVPCWQRVQLLSGLLTSAIVPRKVTTEEIERLKEGDMLESAFTQFAEQARGLYRGLIDERDSYMAARIISESDSGAHRNLLAVVGAGHLKGIRRYLDDYRDHPPAETLAGVIAKLDEMPAPSRWPALISWLVVALILGGFAVGFTQDTAIGWGMITDWIMITGGLAALGTLLAGGHLLTVGSAFLAAPLTTLNPLIGVGMITAAVEAWLRRPSIGDFSRLRADVSRLKGWWYNRVARTLLVFLFSSLGAAAGTYLAGVMIFRQLTQH